MNVGETIMINGVNERGIREDGKWHRAVCKDGVGCSSVMCSQLCRGIIGILQDAVTIRYAVYGGTHVSAWRRISVEDES